MPINVIRVRACTPVCQGCWSNPAVNEVTVGAASPYHMNYCQPCTNRLISETSAILNCPVIPVFHPGETWRWSPN